MAKVRQDAWSEENDLMLADTVLRHVREGSTQLRAFDEVGDRLNRTSAACGFRWNAIVRDKYQQAIEIAKKQRKQRKRMQPKQSTETPQLKSTDRQNEQQTLPQPQPEPTVTFEQSTGETTLEGVISYLQGLLVKNQSSEGLEMEKVRLEGETGRLRTENEDLKKQLARLEREHQTVKEDYQSLMQIMDRARKMVVFQEEEQNTSAFRMDKNGNLEKIAK